MIQFMIIESLAICNFGRVCGEPDGKRKEMVGFGNFVE